MDRPTRFTISLKRKEEENATFSETETKESKITKTPNHPTENKTQENNQITLWKN